MRMFAAFFTLILFSLNSHAALIEIEHTYDLNDGLIFEYFDGSSTSTGEPSLAFKSNIDVVVPDAFITEGDTLRINVSFLDGQRLRWADDGNTYFGGTSEHFSIFASGDESFGTDFDRTYFELKDVTGNALLESFESFSGSGSGGGAIISSRSGGVVNLTDSYFDFSGFIFEADISTLHEDDADNSATINSLDFRFTSGEFEILENVDSTSVPAPSAFSLFFLALIGLGVSKRKVSQA